MRATEKEIQAWLSTWPAATRKGLKVVTSKDLGQDFVLRMDIKRPSILTPRLPMSVKSKEDKSVPRISTTTYIGGCLVGYGRFGYDVEDGSDKDIEKFNGYKGGYEVSMIDFDVGIYPSYDLVPEEYESDEIWLVNFNKAYAQASSKKIGELFVSEFSYIPRSRKQPDEQSTWFFKHTLDKPVLIKKDHLVEPGAYELKLLRQPSLIKPGVRTPYSITARKVPDAEYEGAKKYHAALLSRSDTSVTYPHDGFV